MTILTNRGCTAWLFAGLIVVALLAACGDGGDQGDAPDTLPELQAAFNTAPVFLHDYFAELKSGGASSNPETRMTLVETTQPHTYFSYRLQVEYQGKMVFDEEVVKGVPVAAHGFTSGGEYVIVVNRLYSNATYASAFVNGQRITRLETEMVRTDFKSIRDLGNGWIVLVTGYFADCGWKLYNLKTGEFRDYGFAACPKKFEP